MTKFFGGNSLAAFARTNALFVDGNTTSGRFDSAYVANCLYCPSGGANNTIDTPEFTVAATGEFYLRFDAYPGWSSGYTPVTLRNGSTPVVRVYMAGATPRVDYWNGSTWVTLFTTASGANNVLNTYVLHVTIGGFAELLRGGASLGSSSDTWTGAQSQITNFQLSPANGNSYYSQIMAADYDIRDSHLIVPALNGDSAANTSGTGGYGTVGEAVLDDTTSVKLTASGNKRGQTFADISVPSGYIIGAMVVSARARVSGSITDGKLGVRGSSGTNSSSSALGCTGGYEPRQAIFETDPDTATEFTQSGFNASEIYEEAA
ncbi:hypothetical protein [Novosphingobium sp. KN65.2]|uniref:hypothetical protein n=1 Tax=Novosphingobium sp. KN65.2 TaxID=1478134 RepID=UPI0005E66FBF|nr:hypothetical protein [Novosphingobium sp. KN65.2]CDO34215.1 hypothetical protein SPHV1_1310005 [Novosphingobium sp. KN65.2]